MTRKNEWIYRILGGHVYNISIFYLYYQGYNETNIVILKVYSFYKVTLNTMYEDYLAFNFANPSFFMDYLFDVTPSLLAYFP